jgi:hypothetical protein
MTVMARFFFVGSGSAYSSEIPTARRSEFVVRRRASETRSRTDAP